MSVDPTLDKLKRQIQEAKKTTAPPPFQEDTPQNLAGKFFNVGVELVAGVLVGVALGLLIDWVFETSPWGLISLFILGSAAGMLNVYRSLTTKEKQSRKQDPNV